MNDPKLNSLLKWGIRNSENAREDPTSQSDPKAERDGSQGLDQETIAALFGGPSDADRMKDAMAAIISPQVDLDNKLIAFDNFEQLIENLDNANNMQPLCLWMPLVDQLDNPEGRLRAMAAWCIATAVQNNEKSQERCLAIGAIPRLVQMALHDDVQQARKKAVFALSSEIRNYPPALSAAIQELPQEYGDQSKIEAGDMDAIDNIIGKLRESYSTMEVKS
ncbi:MAG: hsp70 nucleotide exchange factor fes1 [Chrysothrix sp. TS-e1954]|nr:MAG: hsp70 nucleotide exchange factor fes1 [Chrysothrix sp. TS-e1954]